jgi:hypothetical protein
MSVWQPAPRQAPQSSPSSKAGTTPAADTARGSLSGQGGSVRNRPNQPNTEPSFWRRQTLTLALRGRQSAAPNLVTFVDKIVTQCAVAVVERRRAGRRRGFSTRPRRPPEVPPLRSPAPASMSNHQCWFHEDRALSERLPRRFDASATDRLQHSNQRPDGVSE